MGTASWYTTCRPWATMVLLVIFVLSCYWSSQSAHPYASALCTRCSHVDPIKQVVADSIHGRDVLPHQQTHAESTRSQENPLFMTYDAKLPSSTIPSSNAARPYDRKHTRPSYDEVAQRGREEEEEEEEEEQQHRKREHDTSARPSFVLEKPIKVLKTEAGELHVLPHGGINSELGRRRLGLGFLKMEPKALLLPQYTDADCLFLVHKGRGQLSFVDDGDLRNVDLEEGDVFKIDSGMVFHLYNVDEGQRLSIFSVYDTSSVFNGGFFHSFFVAGGRKPRTILSGFDERTLVTAFKAPIDEIRDVLSSQTRGPIIYSVRRNESTTVSSGLLNSLTSMLDKYIGLPSIFPRDSRDKPYNIFKKDPNFNNEYGSTAAIDDKDFKLLKDVDKSVFLVRLKAGAILAPHWNPVATEIALVTKGEGEIQIVYPNGTAAATEQVREGNVFYVPRNFPMCQIASRSGPFEFVGFSTSSRPNRPQFLAGANSVLKTLDNDTLASAFNMPSEHLKQFFNRQTEAVILPGEPLPPVTVSSSFVDRRSRKVPPTLN